MDLQLRVVVNTSALRSRRSQRFRMQAIQFGRRPDPALSAATAYQYLCTALVQRRHVATKSHQRHISREGRLPPRGRQARRRRPRRPRRRRPPAFICRRVILLKSKFRRRLGDRAEEEIVAHRRRDSGNHRYKWNQFRERGAAATPCLSSSPVNESIFQKSGGRLSDVKNRNGNIFETHSLSFVFTREAEL